MSATGLIWRAMGKPRVDGVEDLLLEERCYVCGDLCKRGQSVSDWMGSNYTDQQRAACPNSTVVCEPCVMVTQRTFPVPGRPAKEGKSSGGNFRNYSHMYEEGWQPPAYGDDGTALLSYANASKGQKPLIREFLRRDHKGSWVASIADSGQKHVLHFAPVNGPGNAGMIIFEERQLWWDGSTDLVDSMIAMLTAGATKDELTSGSYRPQTWHTMRSQLEAFEESYSGQRGGEKFDLCVWLAQRDEAEVAERIANGKPGKKTKTRVTTHRHDPLPEERFPQGGGQSDGPLDPVGESVQSGSNAVRDDERVVQCSPAQVANLLAWEGQFALTSEPVRVDRRARRGR